MEKLIILQIGLYTKVKIWLKTMQIQYFCYKNHAEKLLNTAASVGLWDLEIGNGQTEFEVYFRIHNLKSDFWICFGLFGGVRIVYWPSSIKIR